MCEVKLTLIIDTCGTGDDDLEPSKFLIFETCESIFLFNLDLHCKILIICVQVMVVHVHSFVVKMAARAIVVDLNHGEKLDG